MKQYSVGDLLPLSDAYLQDPRLVFICEKDDISHFYESATGESSEDVTGVVFEEKNGEVIELWFTGSSSPMTLSKATYECAKPLNL